MRRAIKISGVVIGVVLAMGTLLLWLAGREVVLQWAAARAVQASGARVQLTGIAGSLYGPLSAAELVYSSADINVRASDVVLDWRPADLLHGRVTVLRAQARVLRIERISGAQVPSTPSSAPPSVPLPVVVEQARVERLELVLDGRHYTLSPVIVNARANQSEVSAHASANNGALTIDASLGLDPKQHFRFAARFTSLDLAAFGASPPAHLSGELAAAGTLRPAWAIAARLSLHDSVLANEPLQGRARFALSDAGLQDVDVTLNAAGNRVAARGAFGRNGDRLTWQLDAPALARLGKGFGGDVRGSGWVGGSYARPTAHLVLDARALRLLDRYRLGRFHGELDLQNNGAMQSHILASDYRGAGLRLNRMRADASGTVAQHKVDVEVQNTEVQAEMTLQGGWRGGQWRGSLVRLDNRGAYAFRLEAPAPLRLARNDIELRDARLALASGHLVIDRFEQRAGGLRTRGHAQAIPLAYAQTLLPGALPLRSTLTLGADWDVSLSDSIDGHARLWRERGDLIIRTEPALALGLTRLVFALDADRNRLTLQADVDGAQTGKIALSAQAPLEHRGSVWGIAANASFQADAQAAMPSLAWLSMFGKDNWVVAGGANLEMHGRGTLSRPEWSGHVRGERLALKVPTQGLALSDGTLDGVFEGDRLTITTLRMHGGEGTLTVTGGLRPVARAGQLHVVAERLQVSHLPNREIIASGNGDIALQDQQLRVGGRLKVDRARIELPKHDAPTLSEDVVVVGRQTKTRPQGMPLAMQLDVQLDLGDKFYLQGRGLDARLAGAVRVQAKAGGLPEGSGSIHVAEGQYSAYGQRLQVERGIVTFSGPLENPALDILAMRKNQTAQPGVAITGTAMQSVQAGVAITGTAMQPVVRLVSVPDVPDNEKLAWLVLGHGLEGSSGSELNLLGGAASSLLSKGESVSLQSKIAQSTGLDEFRVGAGSGVQSGGGGGGLQSTVVTVGKRLSSQAYLTYERSLSGTGDLLRMRYRLSPAWSVETQSGSKDTAVDLLYTWSFD